MYQDPADTPRDAGQEGVFPGICEYLTLHGEDVTETWFHQVMCPFLEFYKKIGAILSNSHCYIKSH